MFGWNHHHHTERDPVVRLWTELTGRTLSPKERHLFLRRKETDVLRGLLTQYGAEWMRAAAKRCVRQDEDGQVQLRLADWVAMCHAAEERRRTRL